MHLLPWGLGGYLTEACNASGACVPPRGGGWPLEQADSVAATGYFKAPNAGARDAFGSTLALSADGSALAVGAPHESSSYTGTFAPTDDDYQAALDSNGTRSTGAVTVYRRSNAGRWEIEAFVKAPVDGADDNFGTALALSADGATLAVGAPYEDSSYTGAFAPTDDDYQAALDSSGTSRSGTSQSGAVTVYRRSNAGRWEIEAFVKAPVASFLDWFGSALALDSSGTTLAVGAPGESSSYTGAFAPSDEGYQAALDSDRSCYRRTCAIGAVTIYRRSGSAWSVEAFVKAPLAGVDEFGGDHFGSDVALSSSGSTLAVGAPMEDSAYTGAFAPSDADYQAALDSDFSCSNRHRAICGSGAVTVYRRSNADRWEIEAFVKAPKAGPFDAFGTALALSADGTTLAVGAPGESSAYTGAFAPSDEGYQAALDNDISCSGRPCAIGAATVYRRSDAGRWAIEAFVKAPKAVAGDQFGSALALPADGATLAVGAHREDSAATGVLAPDGAGYRAALDSDGTWRSGAAYVYRRSVAARWTAGNFVKASNAFADDWFGRALALSGDGATLAVGAPGEDGGALQQPVGGDSADAGNDAAR